MSQPHPHALDLDALRARFQRPTQPEGPTGEGRSLGFFEGALDLLPLPAAILRGGLHVWANRRYLARFGTGTPASVSGRPFQDLLRAEDLPAWQAHLAAGSRMQGTPLPLTLKVPQGGSPLEADLHLQTFHQGATDYQVVVLEAREGLRQAEDAFRRNEHWWRHFFEASIVGVAVLSPDRHILDANQALLDLAGYEREEIVGRHWATWLGEAEAPSGSSADPGTSPLAPQKAELTILRKDGHPVPLRVGSHPIYAPDGNVQCYLALVEDLTELHTHKAREALLLQAIEQSANTVVITDARGGIEFVNQAFLNATGYSREEVLGRNPRILKSGLQSKDLYEELWKTLIAGDTWSGRLCNRRKDGTLYWEQATISPVLEGGRITHYFAVKENITGYLELEASHRRLAAAIDQTHEGVFLATPTGRLLYGNPAFLALLPQEEALAPGAFLGRLLPSGQRMELLRAMRRNLREGRSWEGRIRYSAGVSKSRVLGATLSWTQAPDGLGAYLVGIVQDLTQELEADRSLFQVEKLNALGALAGGVAHDLNNVLMAIFTATELLEWELPSDAQALPKLQVIRQAALRAQDINRRIQTFSQQGQETLIPLDFSGLVKEVCTLLKTTLPPNIHFVTSLGSSLWTVGNPAQLHQVLMNLAVNSYQAIEGRPGNLEIALREVEGSEGESSQLILTVADDGPGIPPEILQQVFEPYFTTKGGRGGTGLGLSVVQKILAGHGGSIRLESAPGLGTKAEVRLPMTSPGRRPEASRPDQSLSGLESVLLVGEDEIQLALMKQGLTRLGYQVTALSDGMVALEALRRNPTSFDVVVSDLHPKGLSGTSLLGHLRQIRRDLACILVTDPGAPMATTGEPGAADGYLTRPAGLQDLARAIRDVAPRLVSRPPRQVGEVPESPRSLRVLLAEDSSSTRALVGNWLRKLGCEVTEARDGAFAWEAFVQGQDHLDLIFTDLIMPRVDGLQLIERVRTGGSAIPIVVLTSLEDHQSAKDALNLGVDELLGKPFTQRQLGECLDRLVLKLQQQRRAHESHVTAGEVRKAQKALVASPEPDVPIYTIHQPLTDAGGDLFKWFRRPDGSLFFILGDVMGHSVMSSYAVAAFLGTLSGLAPKASDLRDLLDRLNQAILEGPFPEIPVCALLGHWDLRTGRLHLLNAGIPHGYLADCEEGRTLALEINGTPLGFFPQVLPEEKVVWLREGDRVLFTTDGLLECGQEGGRPFQDRALELWSHLGGTTIPQALEVFCAAATLGSSRGIQDDVMVLAFEQGHVASEGCVRWVRSEMGAVEEAIQALEEVLEGRDPALPLSREQRFDILTATREALINAVTHGNQGRAEAPIRFQARWCTPPTRLEVVVADEGLGFEGGLPLDIPAPESTRGRGLAFIHEFATTARMAGGELTLTFAWEA